MFKDYCEKNDILWHSLFHCKNALSHFSFFSLTKAKHSLYFTQYFKKIKICKVKARVQNHNFKFFLFFNLFPPSHKETLSQFSFFSLF